MIHVKHLFAEDCGAPCPARKGRQQRTACEDTKVPIVSRETWTISLYLTPGAVLPIKTQI